MLMLEERVNYPRGQDSELPALKEEDSMSREQEGHSESTTKGQGIASTSTLFRTNGHEADDMVFIQHLALPVAMLFDAQVTGGSCVYRRNSG